MKLHRAAIFIVMFIHDICADDEQYKILYCKTNFMLEVNGTAVSGGTNKQSQTAKLTLKSVRAGQIVIKGSIGGYVCMDRNGVVSAKTTYVQSDCVFNETLLPNNYNSYSAAEHLNPETRANMHLAIDKAGNVRSGKRTAKTNNSAQWLVLVE
ncbi:fibroblast growth factor 22 [Grouper iridovirus]|uniref:Fibroblast growth factor 22 n=1 Tax=Grouper iridovirus TaxID=127569 RepID=Q5GAD8_9VIRU|nr:fibroblast growth factor 22 [Grouper iridovirus]